MKNYAILVEYDGRDFLGWQRQAQGTVTVQGVLEEALSRLCDPPVTLHGSGRTDTGVHARGQTANFNTTSARTCREIINGGNCLLPAGVAIIDAREVEADFQARFRAIGKIYEYDFLISNTRRPLWQGRSWWVGPNLDWEAVNKTLPDLIGEQDFAAFQSAGSEVKSTIRTIHRAFLNNPYPEIKRFTLEGSGFLRHMVRAIAGLLVEIGRGRRETTSLKNIIASKNRALSGPTAPPDGLYLAEVLYTAARFWTRDKDLRTQGAELRPQDTDSRRD